MQSPKSRSLLTFILALRLVSLPAAAAPATAPDIPLAEVTLAGTTLYLQPLVPADGWQLTISGPAGVVVRNFTGDGALALDLATLASDGVPLDGSWRWELRRVTPTVERPEGAVSSATTKRAGHPESAGPFVQSGAFAVRDGLAVTPTDRPEPIEVQTKQSITESLCVGSGCSPPEAFGTDTLRLKENIVRLHFNDDSTSVNFPDRDWRLVANDTAEFGDEYFALEDVDAGTLPVYIDGGLNDDALHLNFTGLGLGTGTPMREIHVVDGDTPTLRLEQDTSSAFAAYTWELAANETSFTVRDITGGSTIPFRINPGGSSNTLVVDSGGQVGINAGVNPQETLHVTDNSGITKLLVAETSGTTDGRQLFELRNNGNVNFILVNTAGNTWQMIADTTGSFPGYSLSRQGSGQREFRVGNTGNIYAGGTLVHSSSRTLKENFVDLDPRQVLRKVRELPVSQWNYIRDGAELRHVGPTAEDFRQAFGLGEDDRTIAVSDSVGVTMAAVQGLDQEVREKDRRIRELEERLARVEALLATQTDD